MRLLVVLLCLVTAGCGSIGAPLPPLLDIPQTPTGLSAVQRGERVLVSWPAPSISTEGVTVRPERLGPLKLYRALFIGFRETVNAQNFKERSTVAQTLDAGKTEYAENVDPAWIGNRIVYAIEMPNRRGESAGLSNLQVIAILKTPRAPRIALRVTEPAVVIEWTAEPEAAYRVYRNGLLRATVTGGKYEDRDFQFGAEYQYLVRGVTEMSGFTSESADSNVAAAKPEDTFPPAAPEGLSAVPVDNGVDLSWSPNSEGDLAGYIVFRGTAPLNQALLVGTTFHDGAPGASPRYTVVAVDRKGNKSLPSKEVTP